MPKAKPRTDTDAQDAKARIKEAAYRLFMEKGLEGAKVRDIAEAAGINTAMLNYYFRSKEDLYNEVMEEAFQEFSGEIKSIMNDEDLPLQVKIWKYVDRKTDILLENPRICIFVVNVISRDPKRALQMLDFEQMMRPDSPLGRQLQTGIEQGKIRPVSLHQFVVTLLGQMVFPFLEQPLMEAVPQVGKEGFRQMMEERKKLVPQMMCDWLFVNGP